MKRSFLPLASLVFVASGLMAQDPPKKVVHSQADLPRFRYPVQGAASALVRDGGPQFDAFAAKVRADLDAIFRDYQIDDHATLRTLLTARLDLEELAGDYAAALKTVDQIRGLQDKPAAKLLSGLVHQALLEAAIEAHGTQGDAFTTALMSRYAKELQPLPWEIVQDGIKGSHVGARIFTKSVALADVMTELDPATRTSGALDAQEAWSLVETRVNIVWMAPTGPARAKVLEDFIALHRSVSPEIWTGREVTLTSDQGLTPVAIAIWDSGIDVGTFPGQVLDDPRATASGTHGLAFDDQGDSSTSWLYPLTPAQRDAYPEYRTLTQGRLDIEHGIDSPSAQALVRKFTTVAPEDLHDYFEMDKVFSFYVHGTHCAGIAVRGNPAARLVVARFDDQLPDMKFPPTDAWVRKLGADFQAMAEFFRSRNVRVVNMSWGDQPQEFESWLDKTGGGNDAAARKANAAHLFRLWSDAVKAAIQGSPGVLFVTAAGNSDSNPGFDDDIPASFHLPNLIAVGAVNQAGDETSFTSYGDSVVVDANGYEVDSFIPGGGRLRLSGTSMASPNVVNLAAKLFALKPSLTPGQVIHLIRAGASVSPDGRRHLIDERESVRLLQSGGS
jgi:subtilisin family serine protease